MLVRLVSAAGTGYFYTMRRNRARPEKLILMKHDPIGMIAKSTLHLQDIIRLPVVFESNDDFFLLVNKHVLFVETKVKKGASSR